MVISGAFNKCDIVWLFQELAVITRSRRQATVSTATFTEFLCISASVSGLQLKLYASEHCDLFLFFNVCLLFVFCISLNRHTCQRLTYSIQTNPDIYHTGYE